MCSMFGTGFQTVRRASAICSCQLPIKQGLKFMHASLGSTKKRKKQMKREDDGVENFFNTKRDHVHSRNLLASSGRKKKKSIPQFSSPFNLFRERV